MERDIEKDLMEIEHLIKEHEKRDNTFTMSVLQRCYELVTELMEYRNLEEQGLLPQLPCSIGSDVYFIPSKVVFELNKLNGHEENNRVYHQKVKKLYLRNADGIWNAIKTWSMEQVIFFWISFTKKHGS